MERYKFLSDRELLKTWDKINDLQEDMYLNVKLLDKKNSIYKHLFKEIR